MGCSLEHKGIFVDVWTENKAVMQDYLASLGILNHIFDHLGFGELKILYNEQERFVLQFKDEAAFVRMMKFPPLSDESMIQKLSELHNHYLMNVFLSPKFPPEGLIIHFSIQKTEISNPFSIILKHYENLRPKVRIVQLDANSGNIHIDSTETFHKYGSLILSILQERMAGIV
jgi:hypothetical protein